MGTGRCQLRMEGRRLRRCLGEVGWGWFLNQEMLHDPGSSPPLLPGRSARSLHSKFLAVLPRHWISSLPTAPFEALGSLQPSNPLYVVI
jgi:hypothetical protein